MSAKSRAVGQWLCFTLIYTAAVLGGRHLTLYTAGGPPVAWPASGLLFAAFVLTKPRSWAFITLSAAAGLEVALVLAHLSATNAFVIVPFVCVPSAVGAWLIRALGRRLGARGRRDDVRAFAFIVVGGILVPAVVATAFTLFYAISEDKFAGHLYLTVWGQGALEFWRARFAGASLGILTITPFIVAAAETLRRGPRRADFRDRLLDGAIVGAAALVAAVIFAEHMLPRELRSPSIMIPFLVLVSLRGSMTLTTLANMIVSWIMIAATIVDRGPFAIFFADPAGRTTALQVFIFVNVFSQAVFTAIIAGRARLSASLEGRGEELERLNEDLIRAKEAAVRADAAKSRVLAHVTHEIRTPLGAMIGFAELALETSSSAEARDYVEIIHRNGVRLNELVNQTLDLEKIEAGGFTIDVQPIDVRELVSEISSLMQVKAREKGVALKFRSTVQPPAAFRSDPLRVRQILLNLIGNAIKFTARGAVTLSIDASVVAGRRMLSFEIEDTGIGLTAEQAEALFQAYRQGDASTARLFGGTGLGLNLARELARLLGGDVALKSSEVGVGATFTFSIPEFPADAIETSARLPGRMRRGRDDRGEPDPSPPL